MVFAFVYINDIIPLLTFAGVVLGIWAVLSMLSNRNSKALDRLQRLSRPPSSLELEDPTKSKNSEKFKGIVETAKALSQPMMPQTDLERSALKTKLANAGFRSDVAPMVYSGLKLVCLIGFFMLSLVIFLPGRGLTFTSIQYILIFTCVGFYLPTIVLWWLRRRRQSEIFLTLPDALDLLVVCVESGLGVGAAFRKVCEEM